MKKQVKTKTVKKPRATVTKVKRTAKNEKENQITLICPVCKTEHVFKKPEQGAIISFTCHKESTNEETGAHEITGCQTPLKFAF